LKVYVFEYNLSSQIKQSKSAKKYALKVVSHHD